MNRNLISFEYETLCTTFIHEHDRQKNLLRYLIFDILGNADLYIGIMTYVPNIFLSKKC